MTGVCNGSSNVVLQGGTNQGVHNYSYSLLMWLLQDCFLRQGYSELKSCTETGCSLHQEGYSLLTKMVAIHLTSYFQKHYIVTQNHVTQTVCSTISDSKSAV